MIKKVAVCLSGQPRTYKEVARNIREVFESPEVQVDYYIHTWTEDTEGNVAIARITYDRILLTKDLESLYHPKAIKVEHWSKIPELRRSHWAPKTYSMSKALELCYQSGEVYDIIVWTRLDMYRAIDTTGDAEYQPAKFDYEEASRLLSLNRNHILYGTSPYESRDWSDNTPIVEDREFWGRPEEMKVLKEMYDWYINWIVTPDRWREPTWYDIAEHTWAVYLMYRGIWVEKNHVLATGVPVRRFYKGEKIDLYSKEGIDYIACRGNGGWEFNVHKKSRLDLVAYSKDKQKNRRLI